MHKAFFVLLLFSTLAAAQMPVPTPPRVYLNTAWNPPSGATWHPRIGADLQNALNSAHPGDTHRPGCWFRLHRKLHSPSESQSDRPVDLHPKLCAEPIACAGGARESVRRSQYGEDRYAKRQPCAESFAGGELLSSRWPGSDYCLEPRVPAPQHSSNELLHL